MAANGSDMLSAAKQATWEECFQLISNGAPIGFADESGLTAICYAVKHQEPKVLQTLLQLGASPRGARPKGVDLVSWAIMIAALDEKKDSLERLQAIFTILKDASVPFGPFDPDCVRVAKYCASIRMIHWLYSTVLQVPGPAQTETDIVTDLHEQGLLLQMPGIKPRLSSAAEHGSLDTVRALLECGADVNVEHILGSPLAMAAEAGHVEIVRKLLRHKANPCANTGKATPPLHAAIKSGNWELVQMLLDAGAPLTTANAGGHTVLFQAIAADQREMFFKFVDMGVDPCTRLPRSEYTLLHMAARHNRAWCLPFLIVERGLDVNAQEKTEAFTPLMVAVCFRSYDVIRELIATYKADVTHSASQPVGETAVHIAAGRDYGCLRLMHSLGCDLRVGTNSNPKYTILHAAASSGNLLCMQWLLHMRYFDVNVRDISGRTPLHFALTRLRHSASVNLILWLLNEADADVDAQDYHQIRPLNAAVSYPLVVDWLLENGATDGRSSDGLTALEVAMDYDGQVETLLLRSVRLSRLP